MPPSCTPDPLTHPPAALRTVPRPEWRAASNKVPSSSFSVSFRVMDSCTVWCMVRLARQGRADWWDRRELRTGDLRNDRYGMELQPCSTSLFIRSPAKTEAWGMTVRNV